MARSRVFSHAPSEPRHDRKIHPAEDPTEHRPDVPAIIGPDMAAQPPGRLGRYDGKTSSTGLGAMPRSEKPNACEPTTLSRFIRMTWSRDIRRFGRGAIKAARSSQAKYGNGISGRFDPAAREAVAGAPCRYRLGARPTHRSCPVHPPSPAPLATASATSPTYTGCNFTAPLPNSGKTGITRVKAAS